MIIEEAISAVRNRMVLIDTTDGESGVAEDYDFDGETCVVKLTGAAFARWVDTLDLRPSKCSNPR